MAGAAETELERMVIRLVGDGSAYIQMLKSAEVQTVQSTANIQKMANEVHGYQKSIEGFASSLVNNLAGLLGITSTLAVLFKGIDLASEAEQNEIAFGVMLKSAEAGKEMVKSLRDFAATTPLNQQDTQQATKTLLQFGIAGKDILKTLRQLGDVTGGDAQRFQQMAFAFGQMSGAGRLMGQELNQMINAGFNPLQEISRTTGKSMDQLRQDMEKAKITVDVVKEAFRTATSQGGSFFGQMEKQSKSAKGLFSTMQDDIGSALQKFGEIATKGLKLKEAMQGISTAAASVQKIFKDFSPEVMLLVQAGGALVATFVAIKVATVAWGAAVVMLTTVLAPLKAAIAAAGTVSLALLGLWGGAAVTGIAMAAVAIVGLAAAFYTLGSAMSSANRQALDDFNKGIIESQRLYSDWAKRFSLDTAIIMEGFFRLHGSTKQESYGAEALAKAQNELRGYQDMVKGAESEVENLNTVWAKWTGSKTLEAANIQLKDANSRLDLARERVKQLQDEMAKVEAGKKKDPANDPATIQAVTQLTDKLKEQAATLGMTAERASIYKVALKGASAIQLEEAKALAYLIEQKKKVAEADKEAKKEVEDLKNDTKHLSESLDEEIAKLQLGEDAAKLHALAKRGVIGADLEVISAKMKMLQSLKDEHKLMEDGKKTTKDAMTPLETYQARVAELQKQLMGGAISEETFGRAVAEAEEKMKKAGEETKKAKQEIQRFDAALVGSGEAAKRIAEHQAKFARPEAKRPGADAAALAAAAGYQGTQIVRPADRSRVGRQTWAGDGPTSSKRGDERLGEMVELLRSIRDQGESSITVDTVDLG
jgi:tape measure domain-containing protein